MLIETQVELIHNGRTMSCLLFHGEAQCIKNAVVVIHGFAGHKESSAIVGMAERLIDRESGSVLMSFDLPGHGSDREMLSLELCDEYITAVADYFREQYEGAKLILYGTSFGGYLALKYLHEHPGVFDRCILRCPAIKMYETLMNKLFTAEELKVLKDGGIIESGFDRKVQICQEFLDKLKDNPVFDIDFRKMGEKILIIQGLMDEIVECEEVKEFAERNGTRLILSKGADHRFLFGSTLAETIEDCVNFICETRTQK